MRLNALRSFNEITMEFFEGNFNLETVSNLIDLIRIHREDLSYDQVKLLLEIPIDVLENDVEIKNEKEFLDFGDYFAGNLTIEDPYINDLKKKFESQKFTLWDMANLTKYIQNNIQKIGGKIEFLLRDPEVTIRDDVKLFTFSNFSKSGKVFAKRIEKAMELESAQMELNSPVSSVYKVRETKEDKHEYDVALSFAGEDRKYASEIAVALKKRDVKVFYDLFETSNLWGIDLYTYLSIVYKDKARYCLMLLSKHYAEKAWTNHERSNAQARAFMEQREYILPIRIDDTEIPGIPQTIGYVNKNDHSIEEIVEMIISKLKNL